MPELFTARPLRDNGLTSSRPARILLLTLTMTSSLGMVASTIYVPSLPAIAGALGTSIGRVQLTFVGYLLAFAASMLVLGPLSDRYGRRRTIICGLAVSALSSVACAVSPTIEFLIAARIVQGIGACAGLVVGRAITRELWGREAAAQVIAGRAIAATLMQAFAPVLGGYLQGWFGWRANFAVIALLACVAMTLVIRYVPVGRTADPPCVGARAMLASYQTLIGTRRFLSYAFTAAGSHAGFHIFAAGAPAVLIAGFGIRPEDYGFYASLPPMGFLVGSFLSNRLTRRLGVDGLIAVGCLVLIPAGSIMVTLALLGVASPYAVIGPMMLICCGSGLITPNAVAGSLGVDAGIVGTASGLGSFMQMTGAAGATAALSLGPSGSPLMLASVIALVGVFAVMAFGALIQLDRRPRRSAANALV
jgi:MFS transporter, DHA1 family, multidrug resistance protein